MKKLSEFIIDNNNIFIPSEKNIEDFNYSDGESIENYILEVLEKVSDKSSNSDELEQYIKDWPSMYHFSKSRSNLLKFLEKYIPSNMKILEIGSGCGALTRYFGEKFEEVDTIEGSYRRALITRKRTSDLKNVKVFVTNFNNIKFESEYDIVTLIGVLEYAPIFIKRKTNDIYEPINVLLKNVSKSLKENGLLVIGIENRLGLKYWIGFKEDHTGKLHDGLMNYPLSLQRNCPLTFSKNEIMKLLKNEGFNYVKFYYPFPDYKIPNIILSEDGCSLASQLNIYNLFDSFYNDYSGLRKYITFNDILINKSIIENNLINILSNSFLILASKNNNFNLEEFIFKKYTTYRKNSFVTETTLKEENGKYYVYKKPIFKSNEILDSSIKHNITEKELYIKGKLLIFDLIEYINTPDLIPKLIEYLKMIKNLSIERFSVNKKDEESFDLLDGKSVDFTFWNLIRDEINYQNLIYIDREWEFNDYIPIDFIVFRNLFYFLTKYSTEQKISLLDLIYKIMKEIFSNYKLERLLKIIKIEENFQNIVVNRKQDLFKILKESKPIRYIEDYQMYIEYLENEINKIKSSRGWKLLQIYYKIKKILKRGVK